MRINSFEIYLKNLKKMNNLNFVEMFFIEKYLYYGSTQDDEFVNGIAVIKSENDIVLEDEIIRKAMFPQSELLIVNR